MKEIILASSSPRRKMLLETLGLKYISIAADIDECFLPGEEARQAVQRIARKKADTVSRLFSTGLLIAADTIVLLEEEVLGKPINENDAFRQLSALSGKHHQVITALCVKDVETGIYEEKTDDTRVYFRDISQEEIWAYINTGEPLDKAGSYGIQGMGSLFVSRIEGCYFNVVGLPLSSLYLMLKRLGVDLLGV